MKRIKLTFNSNKVYIGMLILILAGITVFASIGMLEDRKPKESYDVSVIIDDSNSDRWIAMRQGLEQAAEDYNVNVNYVSTGQLQNVEEELALVRREMEHGAQGFILQMVSGNEVLEELEELSTNVAVMLVETDVTPQERYAYTGPDNFQIGVAVAEAVKQDLEKEKEAKIFVLCQNSQMLSTSQRLEGVREKLAEMKAEMHVIENVNEITQGNMPEIIVALDNQSVENMVDYLQSESITGSMPRIYGVGCSEKAVYYLDQGQIQTLVVPNEFNMGYLSMEALAKQLKYRLAEAKGSQVDYLVVNKENLYEDENQKILFPLVQ